MSHYIAQVLRINPPSIPVSPGGSPIPTFQPIRIVGPLDHINTIGDLLSRVLLYVVPFAFLILLFVAIWGGYDLITSEGAADKIKTARAKITAGVIGIVILLLSYFVTALIGNIFGFGKGLFF
jgi:hypothetical protein